MALELNKVHDYVVNKKDHSAKIIQVRPAMRLHQGTRAEGEEPDPPVFIQDGRFWSEGGDELGPEELPAWVETMLKKANPVALHEAGLDPAKYGLKMPKAQKPAF